MPIPGKGRAMDSARDPRNETRKNKTGNNETERTVLPETTGVAYLFMASKTHCNIQRLLPIPCMKKFKFLHIVCIFTP